MDKQKLRFILTPSVSIFDNKITFNLLRNTQKDPPKMVSLYKQTMQAGQLNANIICWMDI